MKLQKCIAALMATGMTFAAAQAQAAIDITTATTGIADAGVALLALVGALMALSVSIFGIVKVYAFISKKAGA